MRISTHDRGNGSSTGLRHLPQSPLRFRTAAVRAAGAWLSLTATVNALIPVTPGTLSPRPSRPCLGWPRGSARTCRFRDLGDPLGAVTLSKPRTSRGYSHEWSLSSPYVCMLETTSSIYIEFPSCSPRPLLQDSSIGMNDHSRSCAVVKRVGDMHECSHI